MPGAARNNVDIAGGVLSDSIQTTVFVESNYWAVLNWNVTGHGHDEHSGPHMVEASDTVFINGIGVCRAGDAASCGHTSSGSSTTFADEN